MLRQVNKQVVEDVAVELGIRPSFIEKDVYAVKILNELSRFEYQDAKLVFTGGTCFSKGYNVIKRFSEDLDFRVITPNDFTKTQKKEQLVFNILQNMSF